MAFLSEAEIEQALLAQLGGLGYAVASEASPVVLSLGAIDVAHVGTLIVHRLTNDRDGEVVERAAGEIDQAASVLLPNRLSGEAAILGADFRIPFTTQITPPTTRPQSDGPSFHGKWANSTPGAS